MITNDVFLRKINEKLTILLRILFKTRDINYKYENKEEKTDLDKIYDELNYLLENKKINEAEDFLFENMSEFNNEYLKIILDFYYKLNKLSNEELESLNFSRKEIMESLNEIVSIYNLNFVND